MVNLTPSHCNSSQISASNRSPRSEFQAVFCGVWVGGGGSLIWCFNYHKFFSFYGNHRFWLSGYVHVVFNCKENNLLSVPIHVILCHLLKGF